MPESVAQKSLFDTDTTKAGFRLKSLEVHNWGTFHEKTWLVPTDGMTALLTGANGSGKSTLVDALLTLLVPARKRNYNLSSGGEKRERSERSYVLGAYGNLKESDQSSVKTRYLRDKNTHSVIIAVFMNEALGQEVSLAQCFWNEAGNLKKFYIVAEKSLNITADLSGFKGPRELKKSLSESLGVTVHPSFTDYAAHFRRLMGIRSEKALDLFNQIVAIKEIGKLNDFVRGHMLEASDVSELLNDLYTNFENLNIAHQAIVKAKRQLASLDPIAQDCERYDALEQKRHDYRAASDATPAHYALREIDLLTTRLEEIADDLKRVENELQSVDQHKETLESRRQNLDAAIRQDEVGQNIRNIEREIRHHTERKRERQDKAMRYSDLAKALKLEPTPPRSGFSDNLKVARQMLADCESQQTSLESKAYKLRGDLDRAKASEKDVDDELQSLAARRNNLPARSIAMRNLLVQHLGISEEDLPFAGELIRVKESADSWQGTIERLLHSFSLRLLVPDEHYEAVNQFVNSRDLKGRLVYNRVRSSDIASVETARRVQSGILDCDQDHLMHKLDFRIESQYAAWIQDQVLNYFDYILTDDLQRFAKEPKAATSSGLTKRSSNLHDKDDRHSINDKRQFVLGWDNKDKIRILGKLREDLIAESAAVEKALSLLLNEREALDKRRFNAHDFCMIEDFDAIDWQAEAIAIEQHQTLLDDLQKKAHHLSKLEADLALLHKEIARQNERRDELVGRRTLATNDQRVAEHERERAQSDLRAFEGVDFEVWRDLIVKVAAKVTLKTQAKSLIALREERDRTKDSLRDKADKAFEQQNKLQSVLVSKMSSFTNEFPEDSENLSPHPDYRKDFLSLKARIQKEALPEYEERFRKLLNRSVVNDMASFKSSLEHEEDEIKHSIRHLNNSLRRIDYGRATYVRLEAERNHDLEINGFRSMLRDCLPDVGKGDDAAVYEESFFRIKEIIGRLQSEDRWRKKVTDVRNWLDFSVNELYREGDGQYRYYTDSDGLSGGQKAKLAFTILASGVAYQYGLHAEGVASKSFRFVVIDEAFSKSDESNSSYAMKLFESLGLQLMVVTPLDKIHVAQPYINRLHYAHNNETYNYSQVQTMSIEQYMAERARHERTLRQSVESREREPVTENAP